MDDLHMKLIQANNREVQRCAQNHKAKYRSSKIQGILRKVGVSTSSSAGNKANENQVGSGQENFQDTIQNVVYSKANPISNFFRENRKESGR